MAADESRQVPGRPDGPKRSWFERSRRELACRDRPGEQRVVQGERSWFRPNELLVNTATARQYVDSLRRDEKNDRTFERRDAEPLDLLQITLPGDVDVLDLTTWIRRDAGRRGDEERVVVGPNYCWRGEPMYHGGPGGEPRRAQPRELEMKARADKSFADIATLDTGYLDGLPDPLTACLAFDKNDKEQLDADGNGVLDSQNGHGSFVAGIVHQIAPDLVIDPGMVLDSTGLGDDASVTRELLENVAPVVNLSLGGYTEDDRAPTAMVEVVRTLSRDRVLVAAAGNNHSDRPFWPAAFKGVLAVAAYDSTTGEPRRTRFSNHGSWVDVCAPGKSIVSTFATFPTRATEQERLFDGWAEWDGTSFAAPQVSAVIAARMKEARQQNQALTPWAAVAEFLAGCRFELALADYGLVYEPRRALV